MYVGVIHTVTDKAAWDEMIRSTDPASSPYPEGFELLSAGTSADLARAVCLWRAPDADALKAMLDEAYGEMAVNDCFPVPDELAWVVGQETQPASV
jgi:hypothetical protein